MRVNNFVFICIYNNSDFDESYVIEECNTAFESYIRHSIF